ncbi:MAG TPA: GspH/FimT family pseudopilin, partial [Steroidobacteraceae bacterium]|nr:GspH/FimT family pseudopilin [Steroidobacteraceae bacterium]
MKRNADISLGRRQRGFTLMELMAAIAVLGVLSAVAVPSFTNLINRNRLTSQANELLSSIQFARIEAIRSNARVTFCGAASATADGEDDCVDGAQPFWVVIGGDQQLRVFAVKDPMQISTDLEKISFYA